MKYYKKITLKNGEECIIRNGTEDDGKAVLEVFDLTHAETDFLLTYPDENSFTEEDECAFLKSRADSENEAEIIAEVNGEIAGTAGIESKGSKYKIRHRAEVGISVLEKYWGQGIGKALMEACIECAAAANYRQLELEVAADNERAVSLYKKLGFTEYGRNPLGFRSKTSGFQEIIYMRLVLNGEE